MFFRTSILEGFWRGFGGFGGGKTLPKPSPNPSKIKILKNMQFGIVLLLDFSDLFYLRFLENMHFASTGARFLRFSLKSCFCNFHACLVQKINQKSIQNEVRTHPKSMPKTSRFLTSIFGVLGGGAGGDGSLLFLPKQDERPKLSLS